VSKFKYAMPAATLAEGSLLSSTLSYGKPELTKATRKKACAFCHVDHAGPAERALCKQFN
jgi:hypothetical protein